MSSLYTATAIRDARGRTLEMRQPIVGEGPMPLMPGDGQATYWTKVNSVAVVEGRQLPVETMLQIPADSPAQAFLNMQATIDKDARPALEEEAKRLIEILRQGARQAAGSILRPGR